jgi:amino acid adenylation domain-containing protein
LVSRLEALDVRLSAEGERLRVNAPKGALDAALREEIANSKEEILVVLHRAGGKSAVSQIPRLPDDQPAPLSFAQERLWFLQQLQPESPVYNLCRAVRISGPLDLRALESSLNKIHRRHESLRTKFITIDGRARQIAAPAEQFSLTPVDMPVLAEATEEIEAARLILQGATRPFDLTRGRLLRICLLRLRVNEHVLALMTHHIAGDAWSMGILMRELWALYGNCRAGEPARLAESPRRYRDYASWQRGSLSEVLKPQLDYWKQTLADMPALDLPLDHPRGVAPSYCGARVSIELPLSLTTALNELSRRENATLFMTLIAAFQILLCRWSGQEDIALGAPAANRARPELENIFGLFVNTLVLRTDLSGAPSFRDLLRRAREACLGAYAHQALPFEVLVQELNPQRALDRHPLFQVMLVLQNTPGHSASPAGLSLQPMETDTGSAQFDLSLHLRERKGRLIGYFEYATDLFVRATIERMAGHFQTLLEGIVANLDRSITALPLLSAAEKRQLVEWNDTAAAYPEKSCIHELFEKQAQRTPDAIALECADRKMTYRDLNCRANRLAEELQKRGVGAEQLVGVLAERSLETMAGILAILKAGAAYVPLDPQYPKKRLEFILSDAGVKVLLTQKKFAGDFPEYLGQRVFIDDVLCGVGGNSASLQTSVGSDAAAYVIYTSGSTGVPKGVVALHRGAVNRFSWMWKTYPFGADEKLCQKTSLSFVDSVWEVFGALLQGMPTVLIPESIAKEPRLLVEHLSESGVTRLVVVPSLLQEILGHCSGLSHRLARLRYCFSSGETLSKELAQRFFKALPACRLINLYGSSEVAGDATYYEACDDDHGASIPIGKPIHNTQIHILDKNLQPAPIGVGGELYVAGENLARGYLRRPELTTATFIANPFSGASRLYRTGDLARYRSDGNIEFLGRRDHQIKIRGCRVELGEVEAALGMHPAVCKCLVTVQAAEPGTDNRTLVAYVVARDGRPAVAELRSFLEEKLPDYMVPSAFVFLDAMPFLPNGKVDRGALPPPGEMIEDNSGTISEPRTEIESLVAGVWRRVLKIDSVGVDDNFFELGGHSLMAAEVVARLRDTFARPVVLRDLFDAPTVAGLARAVEKTFQDGAMESLPAIRPAPHKSPLSLGQEPLFVFSQLFGGGDFLNLPYAYRLAGRLGVTALHRAIQEILRRHAVLRAGFRDTAAGPKQWVRRSAAIKLPVIDLARLSNQQRDNELERISKQDAGQTFDLEKPPLVRVKLLRLAETEHVLLVTMHHIISDEWSMGVFRRELAVLYEAFSKGLRSPLPELPVQFSDFAYWQRKMLDQGRFEALISYWRKRLATPSPTLDLRRGGKKSARYHSSRRAIEFDAALFGRIKAFAREVNCTPFMVFAAALSILLHRYTGKNTIRIGTLVANRGQPGTSALIGYFVNALVLRATIRPSMTFADVVNHVREVCVEAYVHQDLPFEHLETVLGNQTRKRERPLYQVMLNYRNQSTPALEANGVTIASWNGKHRAEDPGIAISRLDVNFHLRELSTTLSGAVNYKTDRFDEVAIVKFLGDFELSLEQIVANRHARVSDSRIR